MSCLCLAKLILLSFLFGSEGPALRPLPLRQPLALAVSLYCQVILASAAAGPTGLAQAAFVPHVARMQQRRWGAAVGQLCRCLVVSHPQEVFLILQVVAAVVPLGSQVGRVLLERHPGVEGVRGHGGHGVHGARGCQALAEVGRWGAGR